MLIFLRSFSCAWQAFSNTYHMPGAASQPAYLSEKNRPAFLCRTLTSEDDNLLSRNISNNCLENRCLSSFTCNRLSLPSPFPAQTLLLVPWPRSCSAPPRPGTGVQLVPWHDPVQKMLPLRMTHRSILSHHQKTGTREITTHVRDMGEFCFLRKK